MTYRDAPEAASGDGREPAIARVCRAARRFLISDGALRASVTSVSSQPDAYSRVLYMVERRRVVPETEPAFGSKSTAVRPLPEIPRDPWSVDPDRLPHESRVIAICPRCLGTKRMDCEHCRGSSRVRCQTCGGGGRVLGKRGTRSCPSCRGQGTAKCPMCRGGQVDCETCARVGRVVAWLTVRREDLRQVRVQAHGSAAKVHRAIGRPEDFDAGPAAWPSELVRDTGELPPSIQEVASTDLHPILDPLLDRVRSARQQDFRATVHRVAFRTLVGGGYADVAGSPPEIALADWRPLGRRRLIAAACVFVGLVASVVAVSSYRAQHAFFALYGAGTTLLAIGLFASVVLGVAALGWLLHPRAWGPLRTGLPAGVLALALLGWIAVERTSGPTAEHANAALQSDALDRAAIEARALIDQRVDPATGAGVLDELHSRSIRDAGDLIQRAAVLRMPWYSPSKRAAARRAFETECRTSITGAYNAADDRRLGALEEACGWLSLETRTGIESRLAVVRFRQAASAQLHTDVEVQLGRLRQLGVPEASWNPALDQYLRALAAELGASVSAERSARGAAEHVTHLAAALVVAERIERIAGRPSTPPAADLRPRLERAESDAARETRAEEARRQREDARRARTEERQQRAWASAPLLCCDGSRSPSCRCGDGSHRGCCSHHHGVCGCSAD